MSPLYINLYQYVSRQSRSSNSGVHKDDEFMDHSLLSVSS